MIFSSLLFVFGFLPIFLTVYYLMPKAHRSVWILLASYAFYGWWRVEYLMIVLGISLISYSAAKGALKASTEAIKRWAVRLGVSANIAILAYFKYSYFIVGNADVFLEHIGGTPFGIEQVILPIGISFLTFQSISYILDVARKDAEPARNLTDFLAFSSLFPQLIAGPVLRYKDLAEQFQDRVHSVELFAHGCHRFIIGLSMKLLVADMVAPMADRMFALEGPTLSEAWLGATAYSVQLLFDFAGYSTMAIGLGLMIGFRFVENFNAPYTSRSLTEFWRRWHISLSNWLRDYLYIPLGGNRQGTWQTYRNLMLTMVLGGLWHGANWTFILWGAWHGLFLAIERALKLDRGKHAGFDWAVTLIIVLIGWVMFRATSVGDALVMYRGMLGLNGILISSETIYFNQTTEFVALFVGAIISTQAWQVIKVKPNLPKAMNASLPIVLFFCCTIILNAQSHSPFLYFQF